jgi:hypothetical protein
MRAVVDPVSARLHELASRDHRCVAEDGDQVALAAGFDAQHAEAVLIVVEGNALDEAGEDLGWRARPRCLPHHGMMAIKILERHRDQAGTVWRAAFTTGGRARRSEVYLGSTESAAPRNNERS